MPKVTEAATGKLLVARIGILYLPSINARHHFIRRERALPVKICIDYLGQHYRPSTLLANTARQR